ncbi:hypothetical protein [Burkholderia ubonensis]|uniref:hypothetical protein n=1 Tax=Burkholderia ubonensis TaxID=101571 RepID=UPI000A9C6AAB|nr:hypothetical protein [Burkholderia ubonensis]
MARKAQPKFPKKTAGEPGGFFSPFATRSPPQSPAAPAETTELPELMNLPPAH